jgi:hypothetical protein
MKLFNSIKLVIGALGIQFRNFNEILRKLKRYQSFDFTIKISDSLLHLQHNHVFKPKVPIIFTSGTRKIQD